MLPELDAILGHKSAHSFDTGPVMADPETHHKVNKLMWIFFGSVLKSNMKWREKWPKLVEPLAQRVVLLQSLDHFLRHVMLNYSRDP